MRPRVNILNSLAGVFFVCVFSFCEVPFSLAQNRISPVAADTGGQDTQKIKIISAFCIDGKWSFNIYDGVKNKTSMVALGRRNSDGIVVESFDESSQTALVSTPRGRFRIAMQTAASSNVESSSVQSETPPPPPPPPENAAEEQPSVPQKKMTRIQLLNLMK